MASHQNRRQAIFGNSFEKIHGPMYTSPGPDVSSGWSLCSLDIVNQTLL